MPQIEGLEVPVLGLMKVDQNRHDFAEGQPAGAASFPFTVGQELTMPGGRKIRQKSSTSQNNSI
jgi:hypothetical protein